MLQPRSEGAEENDSQSYHPAEQRDPDISRSLIQQPQGLSALFRKPAKR
jgi:hypothetical protein